MGFVFFVGHFVILLRVGSSFPILTLTSLHASLPFSVCSLSIHYKLRLGHVTVVARLVIFLPLPPFFLPFLNLQIYFAKLLPISFLPVLSNLGHIVVQRRHSVVPRLLCCFPSFSSSFFIFLFSQYTSTFNLIPFLPALANLGYLIFFPCPQSFLPLTFHSNSLPSYLCKSRSYCMAQSFRSCQAKLGLSFGGSSEYFIRLNSVM